MATSDAGFSERLATWRRNIASVPSIDGKASVFGDLAEDIARYVAQGVDKAVVADELRDIAVASGLIEARGEDVIQTTISDAFMRAEYQPPHWPEPETRAPNKGNGQQAPAPAPLPPILTKGRFLMLYGLAPDFLIDDMLQKGFIYALTGQTGHAKTAVALLLARLVSSSDRNATLGYRKVGKGRVLYFVGENPDDVALRIKGSDAEREDLPGDDDISFIPGVFDIERMMTVIEADTKKHGTISLIVVDTSAAYFLGNEELSNTQMGAYARVLRKLTTLPGRPCVLVLCHPIKHVSEPAQLLPRGGGAYLNEMDGNLTLWRTADDTVELYHGKMRGPGFQPISFQLKPIKTPKLLDARGRPISTIEAIVISQQEEAAVESRDTDEEDRVLAAMLKLPKGSFAIWAEHLDWKDNKGEAYRKRVERVIDRLAVQKPKLVTKIRRRWALTEEGKEQARDAAQRFGREVASQAQPALL